MTDQHPVPAMLSFRPGTAILPPLPIIAPAARVAKVNRDASSVVWPVPALTKATAQAALVIVASWAWSTARSRQPWSS